MKCEHEPTLGPSAIFSARCEKCGVRLNITFCKNCNGYGFLALGEQCPTCNGTGVEKWEEVK